MPKRGLAAILYGREGLGKTSIGLEFPGPVKCASIFENGYDYLADVHATPEDSMNIHIKTYKELVDYTKKCTAGTLLIDGLKGLQQIIFAKVLSEIYEGNEKKFNAFSEGPLKFAPSILQEYLNLCTILNNNGVHTIFLGHAGVTTIPDALNPDQLCSIILMHDGKEGGMRSTIKSWCGLIIYLNYQVWISTATEKDKQFNVIEGKAENRDVRIMYTAGSPAHEAKNRWNLPQTIQMGKSPKEAFNNLWKVVPDTYKG